MSVEESGETLRVAHETVVKRLRLTHCLTHASCQPLSLDGVWQLETDNQRLMWNNLCMDGNGWAVCLGVVCPGAPAQERPGRLSGSV